MPLNSHPTEKATAHLNVYLHIVAPACHVFLTAVSAFLQQSLPKFYLSIKCCFRQAGYRENVNAHYKLTFKWAS